MAWFALITQVKARFSPTDSLWRRQEHQIPTTTLGGDIRGSQGAGTTAYRPALIGGILLCTIEP